MPTATGSGPVSDVRRSLAAAEALQATIRQADTKASILLGVTGGLMTTVSQAAVASEPHSVWAALTFVVTGVASAKAGWHLLLAIRPRIERWPQPIASFDEELAALRRITLAKHGEVLRSIPWLLASGATTGVALGVAIADHLWIM